MDRRSFLSRGVFLLGSAALALPYVKSASQPFFMKEGKLYGTMRYVVNAQDINIAVQQATSQLNKWHPVGPGPLRCFYATSCQATGRVMEGWMLSGQEIVMHGYFSETLPS